MRQLAMADAMFVLAEQPQRNTNHIGMVFVFDPATAGRPVTFDDFLELYRRRVPLARGFREKLVRVPLDLDYPWWIDDDAFDLEFHVRHAALPRPGTREQFFATVNRIMSLPLDMSRPLWEAWMIEGLDGIEGMPRGSFALLSKMHHAAVDGISGMEMITAVLEDEASAAAKMPKGKWRGEKAPEPGKLLLKALGSGWTNQLKLTDALLKAVPRLAANREKLKSGAAVRPKRGKAPKTRFNGPVTPHKVLEGRSFAFAGVKALKDAVPGATINDVVLAVIGGSLRRYLTAHGELPGESLVVTVPISLRTAEQAGTGGNQLAMAFVPVHTEIADPRERLLAVGAEMRAVKDYNAAVDGRTLADTTAAMPGMLMGLAMRAITALPASDMIRISNAVVTNVPGPLAPMTLLGARYLEGFGAGPSTDGIGLVHAITSLSGVLSIGFSACREMMPDPAFYGQCIADSFAELKVAIDGAAVNSAGPKARAARMGKRRR